MIPLLAFIMVFADLWLFFTIIATRITVKNPSVIATFVCIFCWFILIADVFYIVSKIHILGITGAAGIVFSWFFMISIGAILSEESLVWTHKIYLFLEIGITLSIIVMSFGSCVDCVEHEKACPYPGVNKKVLLSSVELVAVGDAYEINGEGASRPFSLGGNFTIFENGVYRYYYRTEDGGIKQSSVNIDDTTIYYIEDGIVPHLDKCQTKTILNCTLRDGSPYESLVKTSPEYYEFYIPSDSVAKSYQFDLE